jgi:FMN reductase
MSVLIISGSPSRNPSRSAALLDYVSARLQSASVAVESLTIHDLPTEDLIHARRDGDAAARLLGLVARSTAIVIGTPVYNASVPGGLKALFDLLPEQSLHGKLVLPLASGGSPGHQLAIEYSLKPILSALGARHVLAGVFACEGDVSWPLGPTAAPTLVPRLAERLDEATDVLVALLAPRAYSSAIRIVPSANPSKARAPGHAATLTPERCSA